MKRLLFVLLLVLSFGMLSAQQSADEKLALQYYKDKEFDKAIELFEKIQAKNPNSYVYYYYYASLMELEPLVVIWVSISASNPRPKPVTFFIFSVFL